MKCPGGETFNAKCLDATLTKPTWFKPGNMGEVALVPLVMPAPAFLLYDLIDGEINTMVLYKRWMTARTHDINAFPKFNIIFRAFLKALVVAPTAKEAQARLNSTVFFQAPPPIVNEWKKQAIAFLFCHKHQDTNSSHAPTQQPTEVPTSTPTPATPTPTPIPPTIQLRAPAPPSHMPPTMQASSTAPTTSPTEIINQQIQHLTVKDLISVVAQTMRLTLKHSKEVEEEEGPPELLGMCQMSFDRLMTMCGLTSGEEGNIPQLWAKLSSKKMKTPMKKSIIRQWIKDNECFLDSKVILYAPLVTMILTRNSKRRHQDCCSNLQPKDLHPLQCQCSWTSK